MTITLHGRIVGKTIQLDADPGIPSGQEVDVVLTVAGTGQPWGEGIWRSAGAAANVPAFDEAFEQIERDRREASERSF